jgi:ATPase subunit of ABC transporter with duplicated ATPase domains
VIGPNGTGKSSLMNVLTGERAPDSGTLVTGPRVAPGHFTQLQTRPDFAGRGVLEIVTERRGELRVAMAALARYGLADAGRRQFELLSGGEQARLEILVLELEGANLLLLDEPTDNLDADSCEALEAALDGFTGTVVAISHDRAFLRRCDRFLLLDRDGSMLALPTYEAALEALTDPAGAADVSLAKRI